MKKSNETQRASAHINKVSQRVNEEIARLTREFESGNLTAEELKEKVMMQIKALGDALELLP